ncbi:MAG: hypothetical protein ACJ75B_09390 [Flavisolibacter sp.]
MKTILTAITLLVSISSFSQQDLTFPVSTSLSEWKAFERKPPKSAVDKFIKGTPGEFQVYKQKDTEVPSPNLDSLRHALHFLDLNGDGKEDVIFEGESGGEATEVMIFVSAGQSYKKVFSSFEGIVKMDWENNRLARLYIDDWGCCDDYLVKHMIYQVTYSQANIPNFKKVYQGLSIKDGMIPDTLLEKPFRFEVLNDGYKIRSAPTIDDSSAQSWDNDQTMKGNGNSIGRLIKGATGTALAKRRDNTGREWLFVQIDEPYLPRNDIIYVDNKFPTKLMGWISSRFIKTQ